MSVMRSGTILFGILAALTGVVYPLLITGIGKLMPNQAGGCLVYNQEKIIGSELLAQKFTTERYLWPRPSSADYATVASGASQLGPLSKTLADRRTQPMPEILKTTSGSGLDPHLDRASVDYQLPRIASARKWNAAQLDRAKRWIEENYEAPQFGFLGCERLNVLRFNQALEMEKI